MKKLLTLALSLLNISLFAQVKIGDNSTIINPNAVFELESTNKGLLLPRISLVSANNVAPLTGTVPEGMLVYNIGNSLTKGLYFWDGSKWDRFTPSSTLSGNQSTTIWYASNNGNGTGITMGTNSNNSATGNYAIATGQQNTSNGEHSFTSGYGNTASGQKSAAFGQSNTASAEFAFATGYNNRATGAKSAVFGQNNEASGEFAFVAGYNNIANKQKSVAFGQDNKSTGDFAFTAGYNNTASGSYAVAFGENNTSSGGHTFTMGYNNTASGQKSAAFGQGNRSQGDFSFTANLGNTASANYSTAFGQENTAGAINAFATGYRTQATGTGSVTFGQETRATADYTFAAGRQSVASANYAVAIGESNTASGQYSFALGRQANTNNRTGAFIINDAQGTQTSADQDNQFKAKFENGFVFTTGNNASFQFNIGNNNRGVLLSTSAFSPVTDNTQSLGTSGRRWNSVFSTNGTIQTSDKRFKTHIQDMNYGLNTVMAMRPVTYHWKKGEEGRKIGFIAQELRNVLPEVVFEADDAEKTMGVNYAEIVSVLVKAIQEQQAQIEVLTKTVQALQSNTAATR